MEVLLFSNLLIAFVIVIMVFVMLIVRETKRRNKRLAEEFVDQTQAILNDLLIEIAEADGDTIPDSLNLELSTLKAQLSSSRKKDWILRYMIDLKTELQGELELAIIAIYEALGLARHSIWKVRHWKLENRISGIRELSGFGQQQGFSHILKYVHHVNVVLREEAQVAIINLAKLDPLFFLKKSRQDISDWHMLRLHAALNRTEFKHTIDFSPLLKDHNPAVKVLATKLASLFTRVEVSDDIRPHLKSDSEAIQLVALEALTELGDDDDIPVLFDILNSDSNDLVKINALIMLSQVIDPSDFKDFFPYLYHENVEVRLAAMRMLKDVTDNTREVLTNSELTLSNEHLRMLAHVEETLN